MANSLDETTGPVNNAGRDIHVIDKQLPVEIGFGSTIFEMALWVSIPCFVMCYVATMASTLDNPWMVLALGVPAGMLPGLIFTFMKISARNYFQSAIRLALHTARP